ncbi:MAG: polysaccharide biosynthesis tyrosine autokinase [Rhodospirillales bacterium]|nr:polysaccharide biosynthesis tyrosine autokinase [Rhodospirillales bacterium]
MATTEASSTVNYLSDPSDARVLPPHTPKPAEGLLDIGSVFRLFWRRKSLFIGIVALLTMAAFAGLSAIRPLYTAQTDVIIESREQQIADLKAVLGDVLPDKEGLLSEIEVIRSRAIADKVIDQLKLDRDPEFNEALQPAGMFSVIGDEIREILAQWIPADILAGFLADDDTKAISERDHLARQRDKLVDAFLERLAVSVKGQSRVIVVYFTSEDPAKAARIADTIADAYIVEQLEAKFQATQRANKWLAGKLQDLRKQVAQSDGAVEEYRRRAGLLQSKDGTLISQQVADLNTQLIVARSERAAAEARLDQVRQMIRAAGSAQAAADVLGSPTVQELSKQEAEVKRKIAELSQEMGGRHPRLISARAELQDLQGKMASEVGKVVQKLENEAGVARAREGTLARSAQQLESRLGEANASEVQLRALEREADANKALMQQFLSRFEEITAQSDMLAQQTNARILSKAVAPEHPSSPKKIQILALVFVAASVVAAAIVFLVENLDRGFRSGEQIEQNTGARSLGLVPLFKGRKKDGGPQGFVVNNPSSLFGESIRSVYTSLLISGSRAAPRTLLVTSSQPKEGKTTLAVCLTRICAISGKRAVVVDTDLRKPSVHRALGVPQAPGLADYWRGEATLDEVLHRDEATGAWVVPCGKLGVDPVKVLASPQPRELLAALAERFDLVVVDSPPLMAVSDARLLAPEMDASVFAVRWGRTPREIVHQGLKDLVETGAQVSGVVLTMVDPEKHARYGFGDSGYYYKGVKSYYGT